MPNPKAKRCPVCAVRPQHADYAPFCSRGCKDRDLLKWLGDGYRIPGPPMEESLPAGGVDSEEGDS